MSHSLWIELVYDENNLTLHTPVNDSDGGCIGKYM